ncbi:MAG: DUF885 domain-containing protein [Maricaulaceae bacterium]
MKKLLLLASTALILSGCQNDGKTAMEAAQETMAAPAAEVSQDAENKRFDNWLEEQFQSEVANYPESMAFLGIKKRTTEWNDPSREFALAQVEAAKATLAELSSTFDMAKMDEDHQLSYRLFERDLKNGIDSDKWFYHGYPFNQMGGRQSGMATFMLNFHRVADEQDARDYIARLEGMKDAMDGYVARAKVSAEKGIIPPTFVFDHVIRDAQNIITGAPFEDTEEPSLLLGDIQKKIASLELDAETQKQLTADAVSALMTSVLPAYENLISVMETQKATSTTDDGVWKLPDGEAFYKYRLGMITTTDMSADEIHDLGLAEVERIQNEMRAIMTKVGFEGTLQEFFKYLLTDPQFTYEDSDAGRDAYLADATDMINTMKERLPEVFKRLPKAELDVRRVEAFREKSAGKAFYNRPAPDGSRPGIYYANLYDIKAMPKYQMEALAYHEGIPGHHMQLSISQELENVPKFRKYGGVTAYTEGWGLYSEFLPKEMGFYSNPYSDFGRLSMELWRAVRLVVDTGLHDKKWTREQVIDYHVENTPNALSDIVKATERYIVMPGQATAYKIGMIKIQHLREEAKEKLGEKFDLGEYHEVVLASGPVPLSILEERVDAWVASK